MKTFQEIDLPWLTVTSNVAQTTAAYAVCHFLCDKVIWKRILNKDKLDSLSRRDRMALSEK